MPANNLQAVADRVVDLARQQGHVLPREVRDELTRDGFDDSLWKDVLALARASLSYRKGKYYFTAPVSDRVQAERSQQLTVESVVAELVEQHRLGQARKERREQGRVDFIHPVTVVTEDGREYTLLSRDLSATGIRLVGTRRLLGQKVRVLVPSSTGAAHDFQVRILWTCPVGEDLVENGGTFLGVSAAR